GTVGSGSLAVCWRVGRSQPGGGSPWSCMRRFLLVHSCIYCFFYCFVFYPLTGFLRQMDSFTTTHTHLFVSKNVFLKKGCFQKRSEAHTSELQSHLHRVC